MLLLLIILILILTCKIECNNNNWVVILNTSRYWFNYRHLTNALSIYSIVKKLGINDDHIIFMNAFDYACDSRNRLPGRIYYNKEHNNINFDSYYDNDDNLYKNVEIDYKGNQVKVSKFINIMIGNHDINDPYNGKLMSDSNSTILLYLSGHGGDEFLKFQDNEEITSQDIGIMIKEMENLQRYKQLLILADTCQASTLANYITSSNVIVITSSLKGENSYAYHISDTLKVSLIDRFTYKIYQFFNNYIINQKDSSKMTLQNLVDFMDYRFLHSTANIPLNTGLRSLNNIPIIEFFSNKNNGYQIIDNKLIIEYNNNKNHNNIKQLDEYLNKRIEDHFNANTSVHDNKDCINQNNTNVMIYEERNFWTINLLLLSLLGLLFLYYYI